MVSAAIWVARSGADGGVSELSAMDGRLVVKDELPRPYDGRQILGDDFYN